MRRVVSLFLPHWPTDRLRRKSNGALPRDRAVVTSIMQGQRRVIASADEAACRLGLRSGMTIAHAQSLTADLLVSDSVPDEDEAALQRLALWCIKYSPVVAADPPAGVFIDVAGSAHLFQGEAALLADLCGRLTAQGFAAKAAVGDTPGCAWALARYGKTSIALPGQAADALASLPVAALRLSPAIVSALNDVGIERVAQIASKPRSTLKLRFGSDVLLRFDQAFAATQEPLHCIIPPEVPRAALSFAEPVGDPDDLKRIITHLSAALCQELARRGIGARRVDLVFVRVDNVAQGARVGLSRPNRDAVHIAKLLNERLIVVDPGFGIERASLTATWIEAITEHQTVGRHVADAEGDVDLSQLVDTLGVRLGRDKIFRVVPLESSVPERSGKRVPPLEKAKGHDWPKALPRPSRLLARPEKVDVVAELPDHPPRLFVWHKVRHRVAKADGPERIHGEWWVSERETHHVRDYYRVETEDGSRYWLFRDGPTSDGGAWWLHGIGDA